VRSVLNDDAFQTISTNQVRAERVASQIGRQSEDPWKTFEDAFLHAEPPIGPEAAMPYVRAILNSEKPLENLLQDKLTNKINTLFGTLASSLQTVGGSVTMQAPSVSLDISDIRALGDFISSIASSKVQMAQEEQTVRDRLYDLVQVYLPTASKTESTARYFAITSMRAQGYRVVVQGPTTRVFQKVEGAVEPEPVNQKSDPSTLERAKRTFDGLVERAKKLVGVGTANESLGVWKESISQEELARLMSMTDQELAAHVLPKLDTMASIIQLDSIIRDEDAVTKEGTEGALYSPLMRAARANALREMNRTDLGALVRQQLRLQINVTKTPYIWTPAEWLTVKDALSTATAEPITLNNQNSIPDVRFWKELPTEKAKQLFEDYTYKEKLKWLATIGGSVGGLVLGVFLLSMYPVYRTNKRLRDSKEDFESLIRTTEQSIVLSLEKLNEILKQIPILKHLPPMDFVTLHAALRMAAEEYDGNTLSENPSPSQRMFHNVVEAFKKGPYAQSVAEYASFLEFLDKLSHSRRMQNKFINIICPGGARAEGLALKAEQKIAQGTSVSPDMVTELTLLEQGIERQTFRDAARGNIRFRVAVNKAQLTVLEHATSADFPTLDPAKVESVIKAEMVRLGTDSAWLEGQLKELDRQALFELNQASFKAALPFSARAGEAFRADNTPIIAFTVDALTTRTYSVPAAIKQSVYARIAQLAV
jgi:hypothetical protein